jgi:hypothetical protein
MKYITRDKFIDNLLLIIDEIESDDGESVYTVLGSDDEPAIYVLTRRWYDELIEMYEDAGTR